MAIVGSIGGGAISPLKQPPAAKVLTPPLGVPQRLSLGAARDAQSMAQPKPTANVPKSPLRQPPAKQVLTPPRGAGQKLQITAAQQSKTFSLQAPSSLSVTSGGRGKLVNVTA